MPLISAPDGSSTLARQTLWRVAIGIGAVVTLATVVSYWTVRSGLEEQALEQLEKYVEQRRVRESTVFTLAREDLEAFADAYRREYRLQLEEIGTTGPRIRFDELFETRDDGTTRVRERVFEDLGISGFIGKHVTIDDELRRRLVVAVDVLAQYGPAWRSRFANLYVVTAENAVLMYWPGQPWALHASDWEIHGKLALALNNREGVVIVGQRDRPPEQQSDWSDLYFDYGVNKWMVSTIEAVTAGDRYLLSAGHDILLSELFERVLSSDIEGTYNLIFREDGQLIAHPKFMEAIQAQGGGLSIQDTGDTHLERVFALARQIPPGQVIVDNDEDDEFLAVTRLRGPGWYLVTVYPQAIVASRAFATARLILVLGAVALLLEIGMLYLVLNKRVAEPLRGLIRATKRVASGRFDADLEVRRDDEIGQLARSFNVMAQEIAAREAALNERSATLADLNEQLAHELEERKRAEAEVARQREALHQSEKLNALGGLLAGIAHELNNPLSIVIGRSMMLEEKLRDTADGDRIRSVRGAAERCVRIVKTFLAIARRQERSRAPVEIGAVVGSALELVGYGIRSAGIDIVEDLPDDLPKIIADADQLTQVFTNLLVNAQHAMTGWDGPRTLRVSARFDPRRHRLAVSVADSGPGIPEEIRSRIFEPFFTTKPVGVGTGIGLSVSHGIVESHGGSIVGGESDLGGAEFTVLLPVDPAADEAPEQGEQPEESEVANTRRILIVDDEDEIGALLEDILTIDGHRTERANSGRKALDKLAESRFDLVLTDLIMPDMGGRGLYREIRAHYPEMLIRVIFVTGDTLSHEARTFLEEADCPVIEKPFIPADVRRVVAERLAQE